MMKVFDGDEVNPYGDHNLMATNGFGTGEEDPHRPGDQICCLIEDDEGCCKPAGNTLYSKAIQKIVTQCRLNLTIDNNARHIYICDIHKMIIQCARSKRKRKESEDDGNETDTDVPEVDLFQLPLNTLRRYKRHYKLSSRPGSSKAQLIDTIIQHFDTIHVKEKEVLSLFIYTVKTNGNKLDHRNGLITGDTK